MCLLFAQTDDCTKKAQLEKAKALEISAEQQTKAAMASYKQTWSQIHSGVCNDNVVQQFEASIQSDENAINSCNSSLANLHCDGTSPSNNSNNPSDNSNPNNPAFKNNPSSPTNNNPVYSQPINDATGKAINDINDANSTRDEQLNDIKNLTPTNDDGSEKAKELPSNAANGNDVYGNGNLDPNKFKDNSGLGSNSGTLNPETNEEPAITTPDDQNENAENTNGTDDKPMLGTKPIVYQNGPEIYGNTPIPKYGEPWFGGNQDNKDNYKTSGNEILNNYGINGNSDGNPSSNNNTTNSGKESIIDDIGSLFRPLTDGAKDFVKNAAINNLGLSDFAEKVKGYTGVLNKAQSVDETYDNLANEVIPIISNPDSKETPVKTGQSFDHFFGTSGGFENWFKFGLN